MKKIISIVLVAVLMVAVLAVPTSASPTNVQVDIQYTSTAPKLDGVVNTGEYGLKIHSVDYDNDEFLSAHDPDKKVEADFYMTWTKDSLYMAWVVHSDGHWPIPEDHEGGLGWMWQYSCVQFMLSPDAPDIDKPGTFQKGDYNGNYLEVGLSVMEDGSSYKVAWETPDDGDNLTVDDWDFSGRRDDSNNTTTYEVRLPWNKTGIKSIGNGKQIGLTYAVATQEHYDINPEMAEWQDGILGGKNMDAGAVITLAGAPDDKQESVQPDESEELPDGNFELPEDATELVVDSINRSITTGTSTLVTKIDLINSYNLKYSTNVHLRPVEDEDDTYAVVEVAQGAGGNPEFELEAGDVVLAFHSDGEGTAGDDRVQLAKQLVEDDVIVFLGFDMQEGAFTHTDPLVYVTRELDGTIPDESSEPDETSDPADESSEEESKDESSEPADESSEDGTGEEDGFPTWAIILIIVGVVAIGGAVYFLVIKKKK